MKEIKFRAWFKDTEEMKNVAMSNLYTGNTSWMHLSPQPMSDYRLVDIMQFTGLKDKNGREIYEGDILKYKMRVSVTYDLLIVEWSERDACFLMGGVRTDYAIAYGEVIGNVHANPELLEQ